MSIVLIIFLIIFVLHPIADAYAKRLKKQVPGDVASQAEIARLREEVEQLTAQVNRLMDEQSFMVRMLSGDERRALDAVRKEPSAALRTDVESNESLS